MSEIRQGGISDRKEQRTMIPLEGIETLHRICGARMLFYASRLDADPCGMISAYPLLPSAGVSSLLSCRLYQRQHPKVITEIPINQVRVRHGEVSLLSPRDPPGVAHEKPLLGVIVPDGEDGMST